MHGGAMAGGKGLFGSCDDNFQVYFPGESLMLNMDKKNLRISREWLGNRWVEIEAKPDLRLVISSTISSNNRPIVSSNTAKDVEDVDCGENTVLCPELPSSFGHEKDELVASPSSDNIPVKMDLINAKKSPPSMKNTGTEGGDGDDCSGDIQVVQGNDGKDDHNGVDEKDDHEGVDERDDHDGVDERDDHDGVAESLQGMEVFETPGKSPKAVEPMEVTS